MCAFSPPQFVDDSAATTASGNVKSPGALSSSGRVSQALNQALLTARVAQSVERKALNLVVVGSSPTSGVILIACGLLL
eukprot:jgi/Chrzof1/7473/Cz02g25080.t1